MGVTRFAELDGHVVTCPKYSVAELVCMFVGHDFDLRTCCRTLHTNTKGGFHVCKTYSSPLGGKKLEILTTEFSRVTFTRVFRFTVDTMSPFTSFVGVLDRGQAGVRFMPTQNDATRSSDTCPRCQRVSNSHSKYSSCQTSHHPEICWAVGQSLSAGARSFLLQYLRFFLPLAAPLTADTAYPSYGHDVALSFVRQRSYFGLIMKFLNFDYKWFKICCYLLSKSR